MFAIQAHSIAASAQARRRLGASNSLMRMGHSRRKTAPALLIAFFVIMIVSAHLDFQVFGFTVTGWGWVAIFLLSATRIILHPEAVTFPVWIWMPWVSYVLVRGFSGYEDAWHSTLQIVCPVVAGVAASTYRISSARIGSIQTLVRLAFLAYCAGFILIAVPSLIKVEIIRFPGGAISALFFQSVFLANYVLNGTRTRDLICYLLAVAAPLVAGSRGPLAASLGLLIFAIMPISIRRRFLFAFLAVILGIGMFYSPWVQRKMFYSGHGTLSDLRLENPDLNSDGRDNLWSTLLSGMQEKPWLGEGGNADRTFMLDHFALNYLPHNDWFRVRFNYGWFGLMLYALTMACQVFQLRRLARIPNARLRALACAAATCFVPYILVMFTDNVLIYCQAFTVPALALVGVSYAAAHKMQRDFLIQQSRCRTSSLLEPSFVGNQTNGI
jgi:O-antigen ligase/polysaccharide polymerase Wzy-like membrane protein